MAVNCENIMHRLCTQDFFGLGHGAPEWRVIHTGTFTSNVMDEIASPALHG
jgi:hypothetical protein